MMSGGAAIQTSTPVLHKGTGSEPVHRPAPPGEFPKQPGGGSERPSGRLGLEPQGWIWFQLWAGWGAARW